jgi:hypothetical protein
MCTVLLSGDVNQACIAFVVLKGDVNQACIAFVVLKLEGALGRMRC